MIGVSVCLSVCWQLLLLIMFSHWQATIVEIDITTAMNGSTRGLVVATASEFTHSMNCLMLATLRTTSPLTTLSSSSSFRIHAMDTSFPCHDCIRPCCLCSLWASALMSRIRPTVIISHTDIHPSMAPSLIISLSLWICWIIYHLTLLSEIPHTESFSLILVIYFLSFGKFII